MFPDVTGCYGMDGMLQDVTGCYKTEVDRRPKPTAEGRSFYSYGYGYGGRRFRAIASAEGALEISMSDSFLECN